MNYGKLAKRGVNRMQKEIGAIDMSQHPLRFY